MPLPNSWQFNAIGTGWVIQTDIELNFSSKKSIEQIIEQFDKNYSRFRLDSIVRNFSKGPGTYVFDEINFPKLYRFYLELYDKTQGAVNPLVGQVLVAAGYDESYQLKPFKKNHSVQRLENIKWDGAYEITTKEPVLLDFGAAVKGLLVDVIAEKLEQHGISVWYIDASGDIAHKSDAPYTVGLEHPLDTTKVIGTIQLKNESLCASAINRRAWENGHHVIDGRTGRPTQDIIASWVVADSTMITDGLATGLFFEWDALLSMYPKAAYLRMHSDGMIEMNQAMKERIALFN